MYIVSLSNSEDKCGVYANLGEGRGPYDTTLLLKGTREKCEVYIIGNRKVISE